MIPLLSNPNSLGRRIPRESGDDPRPQSPGPVHLSIPRESGDDPERLMSLLKLSGYSPRERG